MPFCTKCKKELKPGANFCSACGAKVNKTDLEQKNEDKPSGVGIFKGLLNKIDSALTEFSDDFSRVTDEVQRLVSREKPGKYCLKNCLIEGQDCTACLQRQEALNVSLDKLHESEQEIGLYDKTALQNESANTDCFAEEITPEDAMQDEAKLNNPQNKLEAMNEQQRILLSQAREACNEMISLLANAKAMTEAKAKTLTENGGGLAMSLNISAESPRGYKHYTPMNEAQLYCSAAEFELNYSDYIAELPTGDTITWAALEAEGKITKAALIGAGIVGALAVSSLTAPKSGGLNQTLKENRKRTLESNAEIARLNQNSRQTTLDANEKNRAAQQSLHQTFMKQKEDMHRSDTTIMNKQILRDDLKRASDKYENESKFSAEIDKALNKFADEEKKNNG